MSTTMLPHPTTSSLCSAIAMGHFERGRPSCARVGLADGSARPTRAQLGRPRSKWPIAMAEHKLDVVGCGSMVVDMFYRTPRIIRADEKILLHPHSASAAIERTQVGGLVLNHLGWGRILGLKTGIFGKLGDDRNGEFLREGMDRLGIRHHLTFDGSTSAFATIFVDTHGDRAIYMSRGATGERAPNSSAR